MLPQILVVNPMAKRHYRSKNRHHKHHHGRRSVKNPLRGGKFLPSTHEIVAATIGGAGAIGVDVGLAYASSYLPAFLQSGWGRIGAQVLGAVAIGYGAGALAGRETGKAALAGALTITAYSALRQVLAPTLGGSIKGLSGLADFADFTPTNWSGGYAVGSNLGYVPRRVGAYMPNGAYMANPRMGAYMQQGRLGYMNPGAILTGIRQKQALAGFGGTYTEDMF